MERSRSQLFRPMTNSCLGVLLCTLAGGCSGPSRGEPKPASTPSVTTIITEQSPLPVVTAKEAASPCPHTGSWAICSVENRLRQSGFVARRATTTSQKRPGFTVTPTVYTLGTARLEVFIYSDSASLARDMAKIDTILVAPRGTPSPWETTPLLVRSGNLAAVFITQNQRQAERLMLALTAGAPQPGSPR